MQKSTYSREYRIFLSVLRQTREGKGMTQTELAGKLGLTQSTVSKCERGERRLDLAELRFFCEAMEASLSDFVAQYENAAAQK